MEHALAEFPRGGASDGRPSWQLFEDGPLKAVEVAFGHSWEKNAIAAEGVRVVTTHSLPYFPAMSIYAVLVHDRSEEWVELLDIVIDRDYLNLIEDDPI